MMPNSHWDDYDPCYECTGYGDDYSIDENGEFVWNCPDCPFLVITVYYILKGENMEKKKENIVCTVCREYGPGKLNDCHIDFMNCRVYDDLVKRLAERLKQDVGDQTQEDA